MLDLANADQVNLILERRRLNQCLAENRNGSAHEGVFEPEVAKEDVDTHVV